MLTVKSIRDWLKSHKKCVYYPMHVIFELVQLAFGFRKELSINLQPEEWRELFSTVNKQSITGIVIPALDKISKNGHGLPLDILYEWIGYTEQVRQQNLLVNIQLSELASLLNEQGIHYVVVKGQIIASYYETPELRISGDIDFYCPTDDIKKTSKAISETWKLEIEDNGNDNHYHFEREGITFEMHFCLFKFYNKMKNKYWSKILHQAMKDSVIVNGVNVSTLTPTIHSFYIFLHLYFHLIELGIGLRQFCDWAMILHARKDEIDHEAIKRHLQAFGMEKAYKACGAILVRDLGLPSDEFTYKLMDKDMRYADRILNVVFYRGNMGHYNKKGGFHGWRHKLESSVIKLSHFVKFYPLAPTFMRDWAWDVVKSRL